MRSVFVAAGRPAARILVQTALAAVVSVAVLGARDARAQCPEFEPLGPAGEVFALAVFQGELYAGGDFEAAGGTAAARIARWNGSSWMPVGSGISGGPNPIVTALEVFDDGTGPALWVGGRFERAGGLPAASIARWNGASWTPIPPAAGFDGLVLALAVHDPDGPGPLPAALHAGGAFARAGGAPAGGLARWSGASWTSVPAGGVDGAVHALASFQGSLYLGGRFEQAGPGAAANLARLDNAGLHPVAGGTDGIVQALGVVNHGSGPELYLAGAFSSAGAVSANGVARFTGASFAPLGGGIANTTPGPRPTRVFGLSAVDLNNDGNQELVVAGRYDTAGPIVAVDVDEFGRSREVVLGLWNGSAWTQLGRLGDEVREVLEYGGELIAAGRFQGGEQEGASHVARYDTALGRWRPLGGTAGRNGLGAPVRALATHDFGAGAVLVAGGEFRAAGGALARGIASWNGTSWAPLGGGTDDVVHALLSRGGSLIAAGAFGQAGTASALRIASFDGTSWAPLGAGLGHDAHALAEFQGALVAGGEFLTAGGAPASRIARWSGSSWSPLGQGTDDTVRALAVFDDGSGAKLYAGGDFQRAGRAATRHVARWSGVRWEPVGLGLDGPVHALIVFDDGSGPALWAGGDFARAGLGAAANVARWNGTSWSAAGLGTDGPVRAFAAQGSGGAGTLWVGGDFTRAGGLPNARLARWQAGSWSQALASTPLAADAPVLALRAHADGRVYAGGGFTLVGVTRSAAYLAAFGCLP